jgi:polyhydroxybutyrate depolymerase
MAGDAALKSAIALAVVALLSAGCATDQINGVRSAATNSDWGPGTASHDLNMDGVQRSFLLHVPAGSAGSMSDMDAPPSTAFPLVIVLHGSSGDAESIRGTSQMDSLADARGFLVAYPNGSEGGFGLYPSDWNAGTCCGAALREGIDDLAFISAVIARIESTLPVDRSRIYIAGFSDGGRMAYHVACQLAPTIAAVAVVSGSLVDDECFPGSGVPVLAFHGTSDDQVAYDEDAATAVPGRVPDMAADLPPSVQFWIAENACGDGIITRVAEHVVRTSFDPCSGANVVLYSIEGGSHGWPGEPGAGGPMSEIRASELIVEFFGRQIRR